MPRRQHPKKAAPSQRPPTNRTVLSAIKATRTTFQEWASSNTGLRPLMETAPLDRIRRLVAASSASSSGRTLQEDRLRVPLDLLVDVLGFLPPATNHYYLPVGTSKISGEKHGVRVSARWAPDGKIAVGKVMQCCGMMFGLVVENDWVVDPPSGFQPWIETSVTKPFIDAAMAELVGGPPMMVRDVLKEAQRLIFTCTTSLQITGCTVLLRRYPGGLCVLPDGPFPPRLKYLLGRRDSLELQRAVVQLLANVVDGTGLLSSMNLEPMLLKLIDSSMDAATLAPALTVLHKASRDAWRPDRQAAVDALSLLLRCLRRVDGLEELPEHHLRSKILFAMRKQLERASRSSSLVLDPALLSAFVGGICRGGDVDEEKNALSCLRSVFSQFPSKNGEALLASHPDFLSKIFASNLMRSIPRLKLGVLVDMVALGCGKVAILASEAALDALRDTIQSGFTEDAGSACEVLLGLVQQPPGTPVMMAKTGQPLHLAALDVLVEMHFLSVLLTASTGRSPVVEAMYVLSELLVHGTPIHVDALMQLHPWDVLIAALFTSPTAPPPTIGMGLKKASSSSTTNTKTSPSGQNTGFFNTLEKVFHAGAVVSGTVTSQQHGSNPFISSFLACPASQAVLAAMSVDETGPGKEILSKYGLGEMRSRV